MDHHWDAWEQAPPPVSNNQAANDNDGISQDQLTARALQDNFANAQAEPALHHYEALLNNVEPVSVAFPLNNNVEPVPIDYPYQVRRNESQFDGFVEQQNQQPWHQYPQQQMLSMGSHSNEPIDVDSLDIDVPVETHPRLSETEEPAQRRMKSESASLFSFLGQPQPYPQQDDSGEVYPLSAQQPPTSSNDGDAEVSNRAYSLESSTSGADNNAPERLNELIDELFGDAPSRESFGTDVGAVAAFQSDTNCNMSAVENVDTDTAKPQTLNIDDGIFDDAEDDIDLPTNFKYPTAVSSAPSRPMDASSGIPILPKSVVSNSVTQQATNLEPLSTMAGQSQSDILSTSAKSSDAVSEANESAFGDAADDVTAKVIEAATSGVKTDAVSKKKKKKSKPKAKPPLTKPIASPTPKETKDATSLLSGKTDLTFVLPDNACRFLGKEFWIFTVQQFEHALDPSSVFYDNPDMMALRNEIRDEIARRVVHRHGVETVQSYSVSAASVLEPTDVERLLVVPTGVGKIGLPLTRSAGKESEEGALDVSREKSGGDQKVSASEANKATEISHDLAETATKPHDGRGGSMVPKHDGDEFLPNAGSSGELLAQVESSVDVSVVDVKMEEAYSNSEKLVSDTAGAQEASLIAAALSQEKTGELPVPVDTASGVSTSEATNIDSFAQIDASLPRNDSNVAAETPFVDTKCNVISAI